MLVHYWMYVKVYPRLLQKQARVDRYDLEMDVEHQTLELRKMNNCACNQLWSEFNTEMFVLHPVILRINIHLGKALFVDSV